MTSSLIGNNVITSPNETKAQASQLNEERVPLKQRYIYVCQLHDGRIVIGSATNASKRIAALNSGLNSAVPKSLQVNRIINIKPVTEERTLPGVVASFCERFGENRVICV